MYVSVWVCTHILWVPRVLDHLELELQAVVNCPKWMLGTVLFSARADRACP